MCANARQAADSPDYLAGTTSSHRRHTSPFGPKAIQPHRGRGSRRSLARHGVQRSWGRDHAISVALDHLASTFVDGMAAEIDKQSTLADQVAAAAVLICAHRESSPSAPQKGINEGIVVLLLRNIGEDLMKRAVELWKPRVKAAQRDGEIGAGVDPARAGEWIVRVLLSFELLPPIGVNLDNPRAIRRFVTDHIINGLTGETP